jgi:hypothetical protein
VPFLQLTESQTARHMAVLCGWAAMKTTSKSTGQSHSPGRGSVCWCWCGTDKAMAEAASTLESSEWKPWGEVGWLQLREAV